MGKIVQKFEFRGDKGKADLTALLDSSASVSLIRRDVAEKLTGSFLKLRPRTLAKVDGQQWVKVSRGVYVTVLMKGKDLDGKFYVVDEMPREAIIGVDFMQSWEMSLYPKRHDFAIGLDLDAIEIATT